MGSISDLWIWVGEGIDLFELVKYLFWVERLGMKGEGAECVDGIFLAEPFSDFFFG
ncbi:hypothetical protein COLO4_24990 [Corchorus olitorius]|uniref:Uncharacterized protein n=1 Tax=Corchorus olitorius TaxID=93759 RepID=A0A1R3I5I0_9ROSI|nr:hypothetical protein COLO4_24990 [Corchorus olitorius]